MTGGVRVNLSDLLFNNEAYHFVSKYISPEMIVVIPVLIYFNWLMKQTPSISGWLVPYIVTVFGMIAGIILTKSVMDGMIEGVLVTAISYLIPMLYRRIMRKKQHLTNEGHND